MGLTINFGFYYPTTSKKVAMMIVDRLYQIALDISFQEVEAPKYFQGDSTRFDRNSNQKDPDSWLKIQANQWVVFSQKRNSKLKTHVNVEPLEFYGFTVIVADGCESMEIGLARHPKTIEYKGKRKRTKVIHWQWTSRVKTEYAFNEEYGGLPNFLAAHLLVINFLDRASRIKGLKIEVDDEGCYHEIRSLNKLTEEIKASHAMIANLFDRLVQNGVPAISSIQPSSPKSPQEEKSTIDDFLSEQHNFCPDDTPDEEIIARIVEGLQQAIAGKTVPLELAWRELD